MVRVSRCNHLPPVKSTLILLVYTLSYEATKLEEKRIPKINLKIKFTQNLTQPSHPSLVCHDLVPPGSLSSSPFLCPSSSADQETQRGRDREPTESWTRRRVVTTCRRLQVTESCLHLLQTESPNSTHHFGAEEAEGEVLCLSVILNLAAGRSDDDLRHLRLSQVHRRERKPRRQRPGARTGAPPLQPSSSSGHSHPPQRKPLRHCHRLNLLFKTPQEPQPKTSRTRRTHPFLHRRQSRIASAVIVDYRCLGEPLFDSLRIHHLLDLTTLVHACLKQLIVPFEPSSFTRGGAPSPSRSTSHRCRQDLDNPSSTHGLVLVFE
nr:uncharacterized protein LOC107281151 [Oryza sativa Japonica Group]